MRVADLSRSAKLAAGETVLILGATGVTGKLAVQIAKILGADTSLRQDATNKC